MLGRRASTGAATGPAPGSRGDDGRGAPRRRVRGRPLRLRPAGVGARRGCRLSHAGDAAPVDITALDRRPDDAAAVSAAVRAADAGAEPSTERDPDAAAFINPDVRAVSCADGMLRAGADAAPTSTPTLAPTPSPASSAPTAAPSLEPSYAPSYVPTTAAPTPKIPTPPPDERADNRRAVNCESDARTVAAPSVAPSNLPSSNPTLAPSPLPSTPPPPMPPRQCADVARAVIDADVASYDGTVAAAPTSPPSSAPTLSAAPTAAPTSKPFHAAADHEHADDTGGPGDGRRLVPVGWYAQRNFWWGI